MDFLSRTSGIPLYLQAAQALRHMIEREGLRKGMRLPSLDELASNFNVARLTMRQAVKKLEKEGLLISRRGQGTIILRELPRPPRMTVYADLDVLIGKSRVSSLKELLNEDCIGCPLYRNAFQRAMYRHWVRIHSDEDIPYGFLNIYLLKEVYALAPASFDCQPPMHVLRILPEMEGMHFRQSLTIRPASSEIAHHLNIDPGSPVAHILRIGKDRFGVVSFVAEVTYPGEQLHIDIEFSTDLVGVLERSGVLDNTEEYIPPSSIL